MKTDIIVNRIDYLKEYTNTERRERYKENEIRRYILDIAEDDQQRNYTFVEKVLKQINLMIL
jgi:hypothetical protein